MPATKIGIRVECTVCHRTKAPHGRSVPMIISDSYCMSENCIGYDAEPRSGCLWPHETDEAFGYQCCDNATIPVVRAPEAADSPERRAEVKPAPAPGAREGE